MPPGGVIAPLPQRCAVVVEDQARIQGWVFDLNSFRRWAVSDDYPKHGLVAYFQGDIWVDMSMEELLTHNRVKVAFTIAVGGLLQQDDFGSFVADRMRWTHVDVGLSTEPDGWLTSAVLRRAFRLTRQTDSFGNPRYTLEMR